MLHRYLSQPAYSFWATIGPPERCHLNGISLAGHWWPFYHLSCILSAQCQATIDLPERCQLNGISLAGLGGPFTTCPTYCQLKVRPPLTHQRDGISLAGHWWPFCNMSYILSVQCQATIDPPEMTFHWQAIGGHLPPVVQIVSSMSGHH